MPINATHTAAARSLVLLAALALLAVSCGDKSDTVSTQPVDTAPLDTTAPATTLPPASTTTTPQITTTTTMPARVAAIWAIPDGIEVAVAGEDGLHLLTGSDDRIISADVFADVVADPRGDGWLVVDSRDFEDTTTPPTIRRIGNDGGDEVVLTAEAGTYLQLHDAGVVDGRATLFYNVNLLREVPQVEVLDELHSLDLDTGDRHKITDVGGWETAVNITYGGGILAGIWSSEVLVKPWSVDLDGNLDPIDFPQVGLATEYVDDPAAPAALAIAADGAWLTWATRVLTANDQATPVLTPNDQNATQQLVIASTDGANRREFTLPAGPTVVSEIVDRGDYVVASGHGPTTGALIDTETGGMLLLPVDGPVAATGQWSQPPQWAIPSPVAEDVTQQIRDLEPQWSGGQTPDVDALAQALLADDGEGECASLARTFISSNGFNGPFYIELRQFCDDSGAGALYQVVAVGPQPDGSITSQATRRVLCRRGVTTDGLCV